MTRAECYIVLSNAVRDIRKRGYEVKEIDLNPKWYNFFTKHIFTIDGITVDVVSRGWFTVSDRWYKETQDGIATQYLIYV